ncbi:hypothetical protein BpHYR1_032673 [Brachionus plicatilis]|uniref:Uncharacterized protein n=1 Tax=Brachionus plicatilis TaxID=10195 RepID=A0A3M7PSM6_BRAPC|nr:hypothetical protein BpHYR1_032673 [Brachionus plicatilis]
MNNLKDLFIYILKEYKILYKLMCGDKILNKSMIKLKNSIFLGAQLLISLKILLILSKGDCIINLHENWILESGKTIYTTYTNTAAILEIMNWLGNQKPKVVCKELENYFNFGKFLNFDKLYSITAKRKLSKKRSKRFLVHQKKNSEVKIQNLRFFWNYWSLHNLTIRINRDTSMSLKIAKKAEGHVGDIQISIKL